jgi:hypothetical protein
MKPDAFVEFADWTLRHNTTPAGYRSVISRAYYGAIHKAAEFLSAMGVQLPPDAGIHARVADILDASNDADIIEVASILRVLRTQRNVADYGLGKQHVESPAVAGARLLDARIVIGRLNTYLLG